MNYIITAESVYDNPMTGSARIAHFVTKPNGIKVEVVLIARADGSVAWNLKGER